MHYSFITLSDRDTDCIYRVSPRISGGGALNEYWCSPVYWPERGCCVWWGTHCNPDASHSFPPTVALPVPPRPGIYYYPPPSPNSTSTATDIAAISRPSKCFQRHRHNLNTHQRPSLLFSTIINTPTTNTTTINNHQD